MALDLYDVCAAGSQTRDLAPVEGTVCVLGAGHAGKLALAAARDAAEDGTLVAVDVDEKAVGRVVELGLCDIGVTADLRNPLAALEAVRAAGAPPADLTVVVVNATGCEPTAILLTADEGTVLFFSMATSFSAAALAADGIGTSARMLVGSGYAPDGGDYALDLRSPHAGAARGAGGAGMSADDGHRVQMRWRDLDGLGHVNHTVVLTYLEEGRDAFLRRHGIRRDEYVVGRCNVSFLGEIDPALRDGDGRVRRARARPLERRHQRAHPRPRRRGADRGRVRPRALGPRAARLATDHRRGAGRRWRAPERRLR